MSRRAPDQADRLFPPVCAAGEFAPLVLRTMVDFGLIRR